MEKLRNVIKAWPMRSTFTSIFSIFSSVVMLRIWIPAIKIRLLRVKPLHQLLGQTKWPLPSLYQRWALKIENDCYQKRLTLKFPSYLNK